jgi:putative ABC transport system permease protein
VIVTLLLGTIVTVLAAYTPARRAARIAPVAAMREDAVTPAAAGLRRRTALGVLFAAAAVAASIGGATADKTGDAASLTGLGLLGTCIAALLLAPVFARWVIGPLGRVVGRPFGLVGQLARTNAVRNPRRTAATAFALTLGLILVAGIAVVGASMKASTDKLFDSRVTADYVLTTDADVAVPQAAAARAARVPGVASVTELQDFDVAVDGHEKSGTAVSGPLTAAISMELKQGSIQTTGHRMIVAAKYAREHGWTLGSRHVLATPGSAPITVTVGGIYANEDLLGPWLVGSDVYRALTPHDQWADVVALVRMAKGADTAAVRDGLEKATNDYYVVDVRDREEFKGSLASEVNGLLGLLYGLLGLAIVIAILGIVNTLALSVIERRREIGMLRAVGMQRAQVRRTIYLESLLIAVFGAVLGVGLGLTYGSLFTHVLRGEGLSVLRVPWGQAGLFLVLAAVVGVLAALWPAFRGARTPALEAIRTA